MRTKPVINKEHDSVNPPKPDNDPVGCIIIPIFIIISYFVLLAIVRVTSGGGNKLDQTICYGALICFVIVMILGFRDMYKDSQVAAAERQEWKKSCVSAEVAIVNRHNATTWDDGYRIRNSRSRLELEMNSDQKAVTPYNTIVSVEVNQYLYEKLEKSNTVRIYYKPEAPLAFLLEEEL